MVKNSLLTFSVIIYAISNICNAQKLYKEFRFINRYTIAKDSITLATQLINAPVISHRQYENDSTFEEWGLYAPYDTINHFFFQIRGDIWYYKIKNKWVVFFSQGDEVTTKFYANDNVFTISWQKACIWDKTNTYILNLTPPSNIVISHIPQYLFNPKFGVVAIFENEFLIRSDIINNNVVHSCE